MLLAPQPADGPFFGALPFVTSSAVALLLYGPGGLDVEYRDPLTGDPISRGLGFNPSVSDLFPVGKLSLTEFVYVNSTDGRLSFLAPNEFGEVGNALAPASLPRGTYAAAPGPAVSAVQKSALGTLLFVTEGTPGEIWKMENPGNFPRAARKVGDAGNSPRRIRYCGDFAFVTNFGDGTLTLLRWTDAACEILETIDVGDSPIGVDARVLANGNIAIATTGFHDHTYWITVLDGATGALLSNTGAAVPLGGLNPGFIVWTADGRLVISCHGNDLLVVVDPGLA